MRTTLQRIAATAATLSLLAFAGAAQAGSAYNGHVLFNTYCFACHGTDAKGNGPLASKLDVTPGDLTASKIGEYSDKEINNIITGIKPHSSGSKVMPKWSLAIPGTQVDDLVAYIRFLSRSKHDLAGDPRTGKDVYMANCAVCHGSNGKGDGVMARVMSMTTANHTDAAEMGRMSNADLTGIITNGSKGKTLMPGFEGTLSADEIAGAVSFIRLLSNH